MIFFPEIFGVAVGIAIVPLCKKIPDPILRCFVGFLLIMDFGLYISEIGDNQQTMTDWEQLQIYGSELIGVLLMAGYEKFKTYKIKEGKMALIKCPDCGKDISDQAPTCIECGRPMQNFPNPQETPPDTTTMGHNFEKDVSKQTPRDKDHNQFFPIIEKPPSDIPTEKQSLSSPPTILPTRWLKFYTYVFLPFKILTSPAATFAEYNKMSEIANKVGQVVSLNTNAFIPIIIFDIFICFLIYGLHKKRLWGWVCNWVFLALFIFTAFNFKSSLGVNVVAIILMFLAFFLPNYFYFTKRKHLFT